MFKKSKPRKINNIPAFKAQAIVEFAIVLPLLLMVIIGVLEVGRYIFIYSAATNASRNAVRYASAVGYADGTAGLTKYNYCYMIRQTAWNSAYLVPDNSITVSIEYLDGGGTVFTQCDLFDVAQVDPDYTYATGDRVKVTVIVPYKPMVNLIPIQSRNITSASTRTILGILDLD